MSLSAILNRADKMDDSDYTSLPVLTVASSHAGPALAA